MAAKTFTVSHGSIRIKVKLLPSVDDVHRAYTGGTSVPRRSGARIVHGFFNANTPVKHVGTIVLPERGGNLNELVPHETTHAVIHHFNGVLSHADEDCATAVGIISSRIFKRLNQIKAEAV